MLRGMSWRQLMEWEAFDEIDPIGGKRGDYHAASVAAVIMNAVAGAVGSRKRVRVEDMLLMFGEGRKEIKSERKSWETMKSIGMMWAALVNEEESTTKKKKRS